MGQKTGKARKLFFALPAFCFGLFFQGRQKTGALLPASLPVLATKGKRDRIRVFVRRLLI
jgi:hypothetical protein